LLSNAIDDSLPIAESNFVNLLHVTIPKIILCFNTESTSIDLCWGMNFDMVGQRIFNKVDFSTNATIFLKTIKIEI
jgi:hypothetical protein